MEADGKDKWPIWEVCWTVHFTQTIAAPHQDDACEWACEMNADTITETTRTAKAKQQLTPAPRYDEVYRRAKELMDEV